MKMKYYLLNLLLSISLGFIIYSCSDMKTDIPVQPKVEVHKIGFADPTSVSFHGTYIMNNNWDMKQCQNCHAADFSGGTTGKSCLTCHKDQGGPTACNTCHGNFNDSSRIAPPRSINGDSLTTSISVGAHTNHLYNSTLGQAVACSSCHVVPQSVYSPGHLTATPDNIINFSGVAVTNIASNASFNSNTATCSNTYCHGNFKYRKSSAASVNQFAFTDSVMTGNNFSVNWATVDGSQIKCGSCHDLPPKGHIAPIPLNECTTCHGNVVDENGNIINPTLHINGTADVRGTVISSSIRDRYLKLNSTKIKK